MGRRVRRGLWEGGCGLKGRGGGRGCRCRSLGCRGGECGGEASLRELSRRKPEDLLLDGGEEEGRGWTDKDLLPDGGEEEGRRWTDGLLLGSP